MATQTEFSPRTSTFSDAGTTLTSFNTFGRNARRPHVTVDDAGSPISTSVSQTIPEVNLNGNVIAPGMPAPRPSKSSSASASAGDGGESKWGSNFWVTLVEPQTGTPFYACPATGEVSWDPPVGNFVLPASEEGEWWELADESRGGIPYYYHTKTNETVWERPDGFVIPLGILQSTSLGKRLSVNMQQHWDKRASTSSFIASQPSSPLPTTQGLATDRPSYRRSRSVGYELRNSGRDSAQLAVDTSKAATYGYGTQPRRSISNEQYRLGHGVPPRDSHLIHPSTLPPIPASPYSTESSSPPSPSRRSVSTFNDDPKGKGKAKGAQNQDNDVFGAKGQGSDGTSKSNGNGNSKLLRSDTAGSRIRSKSSPYVPYRPSPPQSLDAAAEFLSQQSQNASLSLSSSKSGSGSGSGGNNAPSGPVTSTPARKSDVKSQDAVGVSSASSWEGLFDFELRDSFSEPSFLFMTADNDKDDATRRQDPRKASAAPGLGPSPPSPTTPTQNRVAFKTNRENIPPSPRRPIPETPDGQPAMRRIPSGPMGISTKLISSPIMDHEATINMSPVKARAAGKPILLDTANRGKGLGDTSDDTRFSTGARPVLPSDLASDIQQFVQSEFAKQYFQIHRSGFIFRRKVPVEKLMMWQKSPMTTPLLVLNKSLQRDAVRIFKVIQRIMGDRDRDRDKPHKMPDSHLSAGMSSVGPSGSTTSLPLSDISYLEEERWLLSEGLAHGELRDEIYCQVVKQLTANPNPESVFRGWQLLCVLLVTFPPSKNFEAYLRSFMAARTVHIESRVDVMAKYCCQRLSIIAKKGPRGKAPTISEIETASDAAFNPSTFGETLDAVFRLQERTYKHLHVPIILPFLADGILALGGTKSEGIFRIPGDGDLVSELKIRIEKGYYNMEGIDDPHVPASLFKLWLRELLDPLVPNELYNDCIACADDPEACVAMVGRLPTINRRVFLFVISFLQIFLDEKVQSVTKMTCSNLALVMAPNLLRCDSESMSVVFTNAAYEQRFVQNVLTYLNCAKVDPDYVPKHGLGSAPPPTTAMPRRSKSRSRRPPRGR